MIVERLICLVWILIGGAAASMAWSMRLFGSHGPDSGLFPFVAALLLGLCGVALLLSPRHHARTIGWPPRTGVIRIGGVIVGLAVMTLALPHAGFAASGFVTMLILLRAVERAGWVQTLLLASVSVAAVMLLFGLLLGMPLPRGPWGV
ncbi:tripartite tricarboxylate transporter TctB family protein [Elioraea sp.]|uniref:tripartite tricarboxylate transporter TctB family protein n=1 Tax=Elioraea sp. TaxID=2185103 RepID=UPI0025C0A223|nr:tripartite tricarboxylate transporter TctB family protein [Elioraea sp.]